MFMRENTMQKVSHVSSFHTTSERRWRRAGFLRLWLGELLRRLALFPLLRAFTGFRVEGREQLQGEGPYIFVANHSSHLDAPLLLAALPLQLRLRLRVAAAADYFFTLRWKGFLVTTLLNAFPFERRGPGCTESLQYAEQLLGSGCSVLLFPEGTRSLDGRLQPFKRGAGKLALATGACVVPAWIDGAYAALPKGARFPRRQHVTISFGASLRFAPQSQLPDIVAEIERGVRALAPAQAQKGEQAMATKRYGGIYAIKPWWQHRLAGIEQLLINKRVHPDFITSAGVVFSTLLGAVLFTSEKWPLLALMAIPLAIGRLAANALDGLVARHTGLAHPRGEVFNECCDRLSDILIFAGLAFNRAVNAPLAWSVLVLMLLSSYLGIAAKAAGGRRQFGGFLAKADRMIYLALFAPFVAWLGPEAWNWLLLAFVPALLLTLAQRARWTYNDLKQLEEGGKAV